MKMRVRDSSFWNPGKLKEKLYFFFNLSIVEQNTENAPYVYLSKFCVFF